MANWYGAARTNYFRVKDPESFKAWANAIPDLFLMERDGKFGFYAEGESGGFPGWVDQQTTTVQGTIRSAQGEIVHHGTFVHVSYGDGPDDDDVLNEAARHFHGLTEWMSQESPTLDLNIVNYETLDVEVEWSTMLAPHLAEGEVAVLMEAGAEKVRYLTGWAQAIAWDGRVTHVNLRDIYAKAAEEFGVEMAAITLAEF